MSDTVQAAAGQALQSMTMWYDANKDDDDLLAATATYIKKAMKGVPGHDGARLSRCFLLSGGQTFGAEAWKTLKAEFSRSLGKQEPSFVALTALVEAPGTAVAASFMQAVLSDASPYQAYIILDRTSGRPPAMIDEVFCLYPKREGRTLIGLVPVCKLAWSPAAQAFQLFQIVTAKHVKYLGPR